MFRERMAAQSRIHASILWIPIPPVDLSAVSTSIPGIPTMPGSPTPDTAREHRRNPTMFSTSPTTRSQGRPFGPASRAVWETSRSRRRFVTMLPATFMQRMTSASFVCREATPCGRQRRGDFLRPKFRPCPFQPQHEYSTLPPMGAEPTCRHRQHKPHSELAMLKFLSLSVFLFATFAFQFQKRTCDHPAPPEGMHYVCAP